MPLPWGSDWRQEAELFYCASPAMGKPSACSGQGGGGCGIFVC